MASMLTLVRRATALANAGLAGLRDALDAEELSSTAQRCSAGLVMLAGYEDLVKAKGILDFVMELSSFEAELGRYAASLNLCRSILIRALQAKRQQLNIARTQIGDNSRTIAGPPIPVNKTEVGSVNGAPDVPSGRSIGTTSWALGDAPAFDTIVGNSAAKRTLFEHVVLPLKLSEEARDALFAGIRSSGNNILLHGPPGTGKTTIAQATSQEAGAAFYSVTPSSILSKYQGESERVLHHLFNDARKTKPSIVFLDELDALAPTRDAQDDVQSRRLLAELLLQISQLRSQDQVVIIGATNRIDDIDIALLRRFQSRAFVGLPTPEERADMILRFMAGIEHVLSPLQLSSLADRLPGWSGSDIKCLCKEACMGPVRSLYGQEGDLERVVAQQHLGESLLTLRPVNMCDCERAYESFVGSCAISPFTEEKFSADSAIFEELVIDDALVTQREELDQNHRSQRLEFGEQVEQGIAHEHGIQDGGKSPD